jgi:hypothetical protein
MLFMTKNISFFLLVLFSLSALNSRDNTHKRCERKRSWPEIIIKTCAVGFLFVHAERVFTGILADKQVGAAFWGAFSKATEGKQAPAFFDTFKATGIEVLKEIPTTFVSRSKTYVLPYVLGLALCQGVTAAVSSPIF